jgi:large subunit ribosomal protein L9
MKVILRADIDGVGRRGDIVDVADGHARNFLLPKGKALVATPGAVDQANSMRKARDLRERADREAAQAVGAQLTASPIKVAAKAGNEGRLFGSVTAHNVADAIKAQTGVDVDHKKVIVGQIRTVGEHSATVRLHADVEVVVNLSVAAG